MRGHLCPPQYSVFIAQFSIQQIVWLMGIPKSIEARCLDPFHSPLHLFIAERMTLSKQVFILRNSINEDRFAIEQELICRCSPTRSTKTKIIRRFVEDRIFLFYQCDDFI